MNVTVPNRESTTAPEYSAVFCSLGFEQRARFIAERLRPRSALRFAIGFEDRCVLSYDANKSFYERNRYEIVNPVGNDLRDWLRLVVSHVDRSALAHRRILVDVSSMSRSRIAAFVEELCLANWSRPMVVDFAYAPAKFSGPPPADEIPNTHVGPVSPRFAGWAVEADLVPIVILGLGYEQDRALGAVEHIQPVDVWAFIPHSTDSGYEPVLSDANAVLLEQLSEARVLSYDVEKPLDCYGRLNTLVSTLGEQANSILVPFGPKIFALCAMLVAINDSRAAVWRVSAEGGEVPVERVPTGRICGLSIAVGGGRNSARNVGLVSSLPG